MKYSAGEIFEIVKGRGRLQDPGAAIEHILTDSRKLSFPALSLFIALKGVRHNGHNYIAELYQKGVRHFIVSDPQEQGEFPEGNFIETEDTLHALQLLAIWHRGNYEIPIIGITGSNGKTIVKEWLFKVLNPLKSIVRSPKSYNSQLGVPLSVLRIDDTHEMGIFEAGISRPGEMQKLEKIIAPEIGIMTHIGAAHDEGFRDRRQKVLEKSILFKGCKTIIYNEDDPALKDFKENLPEEDGHHHFAYSAKNTDAEVYLKNVDRSYKNQTRLLIQHEDKSLEFFIPFTDSASINNAMLVLCCSLYLRADPKTIASGLAELKPLEMRLELKKGIRNNYLINDAYSADEDSLSIALDFMMQQNPGLERIAILSEFRESGLPPEKLYAQIGTRLKEAGISHLIGVGAQMMAHEAVFRSVGLKGLTFFNSSTELLDSKILIKFSNQFILIKGAREFAFEELIGKLEEKSHGTVLEVDLNALAHNLHTYQEILPEGVKTMAMVKAFAYGSGSNEVANVLRFNRVNYLAVAYADEGIRLRDHGIGLPLMVMNPEPYTFDKLVSKNLEPEIYSIRQLRDWRDFITSVPPSEEQTFAIHLKLETGMHRLGFEEDDLPVLIQELSRSPRLVVRSVFSHLAAAESAMHDPFTRAQIRRFDLVSKQLIKELPMRDRGQIIRHIANTSALTRFPEAAFDMVRLGIGLYGLDPSGIIQHKLQPIARLSTRIAQIKEVKAGDTISYGRSGVISRPGRIATINIGYADGLRRNLGNGITSFMIQGKLYPTIGHICMDMTMLDLGDDNSVEEGDEVVIFGIEPGLEELARDAGTIPYEIIAGISQRVKRVYYSD